MSGTTRRCWAALAAAAAALSFAPAALAGPAASCPGRCRRAPAAPASTTRTPSWPSASPSPGCASTRRRCSGSPTPTTAPASRGPRATTPRSTTSCSGCGPRATPPTSRRSSSTPSSRWLHRSSSACHSAPTGQVTNTILAYSGSGDVTAAVTALPGTPVDATPGCDVADFAAFPVGTIALVPRGGCTFAIKAQNAHAAGASAVVIANNVAADLNGTLGEGFALDIPVTSVTQAVGDQLAMTGGLLLHVDDLHVPRTGDDVQRGRRDPRRQRRQRRDGRRPPRLGQRRAGHQRQRLRVRRPARGRRAAGQGQAGQHGALRLVGRGGVQPGRLEPLRDGPEPPRSAAGSRSTSTSTWWGRRTRSSSSTTGTTPTPPAPAPDRAARTASRRPSRPSTSSATCRSRAPTSAGGPTTGRSSRPASRRVACSPVPRAPRPPQEAADLGWHRGPALRPLLPPGLRHPGQRRPARPRRQRDAMGFAILQYAHEHLRHQRHPGQGRLPAGQPGTPDARRLSRSSRAPDGAPHPARGPPSHTGW